MGSRVEFSFVCAANVRASDPAQVPVAICGRLETLHQLDFNSVAHRLEPRVNLQTWKKALYQLNPSPTDRSSLYLSNAFLCALPCKISRHLSPSGSIYFHRIIRNLSGVIVIVCRKEDMVALVSSIARNYPTYTRRTTAKKLKQLQIEFLLVENAIVPHQAESGAGKTLSVKNIDQEMAQSLHHLTDSIRLCGQIVDMPCSEMHTDAFVRQARNVAEELDTKIAVIQGEELEKRGFGGLWNVGKAATRMPALVVLTHDPGPGAETTIALVGKGIVYDTGGLSLKTKFTMPGMKRDCAGAAACLGAFRTMVKGGFSQRLHCVLCLAENAVGNGAMRPDDIITLYSGKTVEVNNTDAEGRLVLGDGVAFATKDLRANIVVDLATLTGSQTVTTGKFHAGVLSNDEKWERYCVEAGKNSGDHAYPIIYCPEFQFTEFASYVADMKNSVNDRSNAQTSCAGIFIHSHLESGFEFPGVAVHLDIAGPAVSCERGTAWGVSFLLSLFGKYSHSKMIRSVAVDLCSDSPAHAPDKRRKVAKADSSLSAFSHIVSQSPVKTDQDAKT